MLSIFKEQPRAFSLIFFLELWERFGYYTVLGILAYFFVKELGFSEIGAYYTFGAFSALVYGLVSLGGWIGDKFLGTKRTIVLGIITLALGYLFLSFADKHTVFYALGLVCVGNGLFKANPSSLLAKCYQENDPRLHGGFTLYYMAINMGSVFALFLGPNISEHYGWHSAFFLSFIGLVLALMSYFYWHKTVKNISFGVDKLPLSWIRLLITIIGVVISTILCAYLLQHVDIAEKLLFAIAIIIVGIYVSYAYQESNLYRIKMAVAFVLMLEAVVFFTLYQQMPTSLNFFAIHNVYHTIFGFEINPQSFQVLNPLWIMIMSPILALVYSRLGKKGRDLSTAYKFALGMTLCGLSFTLLYFCQFFADDEGMVSWGWLVASYFFQSVGELLVSALGVAMVAELVPPAITGFIMGMWFLTSSIAGFTGAFVASLTAAPTLIKSNYETLITYSNVFLKIGLVTLGLALIMWLVAPLLSKAMRLRALPRS